MTTAEPPEPFASFVINVLFHDEIPRDIVGPAVRYFCVIRVFCGFQIFRVLSCILWFIKKSAFSIQHCHTITSPV